MNADMSSFPVPGLAATPSKGAGKEMKGWNACTGFTAQMAADNWFCPRCRL